MIRVMICDDQSFVREGLNVILDRSKGMEVVGLAADGVEVLDLLRKNVTPDVILMDLKMPNMNGVQATRQIREHYPDIKILVLTTYDSDDWLLDAIRSGANGYLLKDTDSEGIVQAIVQVVEGKTPVDSAVAGKLFSHITQPKSPTAESTFADNLSEREREVLRLLAQGMTNSEISKALFLSEGTIANYVTAILSKLGVADRTQAAILALRYGLARLE